MGRRGETAGIRREESEGKATELVGKKIEEDAERIRGGEVVRRVRYTSRMWRLRSRRKVGRFRYSLILDEKLPESQRQLTTASSLVLHVHPSRHAFMDL